MSDTWYRDPPELPPYEDGFGKLWTLDGRCLNPDPPREPTFIDEWPEDLQWIAFKASFQMEVVDEFVRRVVGSTDGPGPRGLLGS